LCRHDSSNLRRRAMHISPNVCQPVTNRSYMSDSIWRDSTLSVSSSSPSVQHILSADSKLSARSMVPARSMLQALNRWAQVVRRSRIPLVPELQRAQRFRLLPRGWPVRLRLARLLARRDRILRLFHGDLPIRWLTPVPRLLLTEVLLQ
jgi:hypothetical protein